MKSIVRQIPVTLNLLEQINVETVEEIILIFKVAEVDVLILQVGFHSNVEFISEFVILDVLEFSLDRSKGMVWGPSKKIRMILMHDSPQASATTFGFRQDALQKFRRQNAFAPEHVAKV